MSLSLYTDGIAIAVDDALEAVARNLSVSLDVVDVSCNDIDDDNDDDVFANGVVSGAVTLAGVTLVADMVSLIDCD